MQLSVPLVDGRLMLGTWQGIYLYEHRPEGQHARWCCIGSALKMVLGAGHTFEEEGAIGKVGRHVERWLDERSLTQGESRWRGWWRRLTPPSA